MGGSGTTKAANHLTTKSQFTTADGHIGGKQHFLHDTAGCACSVDGVAKEVRGARWTFSSDIQVKHVHAYVRELRNKGYAKLPTKLDHASRKRAITLARTMSNIVKDSHPEAWEKASQTMNYRDQFPELSTVDYRMFTAVPMAKCFSTASGRNWLRVPKTYTRTLTREQMEHVMDSHDEDNEFEAVISNRVRRVPEFIATGVIQTLPGALAETAVAPRIADFRPDPALVMVLIPLCGNMTINIWPMSYDKIYVDNPYNGLNDHALHQFVTASSPDVVTVNKGQILVMDPRLVYTMPANHSYTESKHQAILGYIGVGLPADDGGYSYSKQLQLMKVLSGGTRLMQEITSSMEQTEDIPEVLATLNAEGVKVNRRNKSPDPAHVYIKPSQIPGAGYGLFTSVRIRKGQLIAKFAGQFVQLQGGDDPSSSYMIGVGEEDDGWFFDGEPRRLPRLRDLDGVAQFSNDADAHKYIPEYAKSGFRNNAVIQVVQTDEGVPELWAMSTAAIKAEGEVFISYGSSYWEADFEHDSLEFHNVQGWESYYYE